MRRLRPLLAAVGSVLVLAGCGIGDDADAPSAADATSATGAATAAPTLQPTLPVEPTASSAAPPPFPAETAADVLALAGRRPPATVAYAITAPEASSTLAIAQDERRGRLHRTDEDGEVWVGVDIAGRAVSFVCEAPAGGTPACRDGDPEGRGARVAAEAAGLLGNDAIRRTFAPAAALPETNVGVDTQAGLQVSCLAVTADGRELRLCADAEGIITEVTAGTTTAKATTASADVLDADLEPPTTPAGD